MASSGEGRGDKGLKRKINDLEDPPIDQVLLDKEAANYATMEQEPQILQFNRDVAISVQASAPLRNIGLNQMPSSPDGINYEEGGGISHRAEKGPVHEYQFFSEQPGGSKEEEDHKNISQTGLGYPLQDQLPIATAQSQEEEQQHASLLSNRMDCNDDASQRRREKGKEKMENEIPEYQGQQRGRDEHGDTHLPNENPKASSSQVAATANIEDYYYDEFESSEEESSEDDEEEDESTTEDTGDDNGDDDGDGDEIKKLLNYGECDEWGCTID